MFLWDFLSLKNFYFGKLLKDNDFVIVLVSINLYWSFDRLIFFLESFFFLNFDVYSVATLVNRVWDAKIRSS